MLQLHPSNRYNDKALMLKVSQGDEQAFRLLFDQYRNKIFSIAWKITGIETSAEDVVQEVFIKIWVNKEKLIEVENLAAYINTITRNYIFNALRRIAYEQSFIEELLLKRPQMIKNVSDPVLYNELQRLVNKAVQQLPPQQKKIYHLSRVEGLKHEQISEKLQISRSTVKGHMGEALRTIKAFLNTHADILNLLLILQIHNKVFSLH